MIWHFALFCFFPMICVFLTPLLFYRLPFSVRIDQTVVNFTTTELGYATFVWVTWILVAASIIVAGRRFGRQHQHVWQISRQGVWWSFLGCSTLGSTISALHQTMLFPQVVENLVHILSLSSTLAIILGIYLLHVEHPSPQQRALIVFFLVPSIIVTFAQPLFLGYVNPIAISVIGILYAVGAMGVRWRTQVGLVVMFVIGIGAALAYKSEMRDNRFGGAFERDRSLVSWNINTSEASLNATRSSSACVEPTGQSSDNRSMEIAKHAIANLIEYDTKLSLAPSQGIRTNDLSSQAEQGNSAAMFALGFLAEQDPTEKEDMNVAENWYRRAARENHSNAMLRLGHLYERGIGKPQDLKSALRWYDQAAQQQNVTAMKVLSAMYEHGYGVKKDYFQAIKWDLQSIALSHSASSVSGKPQESLQNLSNAMRMLGLMYEDGVKVGKDLTKASQWYQRAARRGDGIAMRHLAIMYESGNGLPYDQTHAIACYTDAARNSDPVAMRTIGRMHEVGRDVPKDYTLAHQWYSHAATFEDAPAIRHLAGLYENGHGVEKDLAHAAALLRRAQQIDPLDPTTASGPGKKEDDLKEYDPNYDKLRWPLSRGEPTLYHLFARIAHRLNSLGNLAYAIRVTPNKVPYSYWETYEPLFYKLIPRVIWKDKPVENTGLVIGLKYGYSKPTDKPFVWSMPTVFESWMAFGWTGVLLTAIIVGVLLHVAWRFFVGTSPAIGNIVFGTLIVMSTAHLSMSSLNLVIGGMIHNVFVFGVLIAITMRIFSLKT